MKPIVALLAGSLLLNALAGAAWLLTADRTPVDTARSAAPPTSVAITLRDAGAISPAPQTATQTAHASDAEALVERLRALGFDEVTIRDVVRARLSRAYRDRIRQFNDDNQRNAPAYWKSRSTPYGSLLTKEQREELRSLEDATQDEMKRLFGSADIDDPLFRWARNYDFLPADRARQLQRLERDYSELEQQLREEMAGFPTPADREMQKLLAEGRKQDFEALLSPEEREAYELRHSRSAYSVMNRLRAFDATEDEYKSLFALQKAFDETFSTDQFRTGNPPDPDWGRRRSVAEQEMQKSIETVLGPDRYAQYRTSQQQDYQTLVAAATRFKLEPSVISSAWSTREQTLQRVQTISNDRTLTVEQRQTAFAAVAAETAARLESTLGREITGAYLSSSARWLDQLAQHGGELAIDSRGNPNARPPSGPGAPSRQVSRSSTVISIP